MNITDDPFFSSGGGDGQTIIRPVPGGSVQDLQRQTGTAFTKPKGAVIPLAQLSKLNPLDNAASSILALAANLYSSPSNSVPTNLKNQLIQEIKKFQVNATKTGIERRSILAARYILCTTIDEAVFNTPWGRESGWAEQSLLSIFHNEVSGGTRFFQLLQNLGKNPTKHLHLLELMYVCLSLGFQGRYRMDQSGREKVIQIRSWLANLIRQTKGSAGRSLSPHWLGVEVYKTGLIRQIPAWMFFLVAAGSVVLLYLGLLFSLGSKANPVYSEIQALNMSTSVSAVLPKAKPQPPPFDQIAFLKRWLEPEIIRGLVKIHDPGGKIEIRGDLGLFSSGSDSLLDHRVQLVEKIADALASPELNHHNYYVIGHTDNVPIRTSIRFANNWQLSKARAETVSHIMQAKQPGLFLRTDGMADSNPIDSNESKQSRARNRRVDIVLD